MFTKLGPRRARRGRYGVRASGPPLLAAHPAPPRRAGLRPRAVRRGRLGAGTWAAVAFKAGLRPRGSGCARPREARRDRSAGGGARRVMAQVRAAPRPGRCEGREGRRARAGSEGLAGRRAESLRAGQRPRGPGGSGAERGARRRAGAGADAWWSGKPPARCWVHELSGHPPPKKRDAGQSVLRERGAREALRPLGGILSRVGGNHFPTSREGST